MGSAVTKFRKHLQNGDEYAAMQLYNSSPDLRKSLDPNTSYGDAHEQNTPLHYVSRQAIKSLLRIFLQDLGGNPNKLNIHNHTSLHCVCMPVPVGNKAQTCLTSRRAECLLLILQWRGPVLENGDSEKIHLNALDEKSNTALHYAAGNGLKRCVELLVSYGASLFVENENKETACDCAEKAGHRDLAVYLESKMVFSNDNSDGLNEGDIIVIDTQEPYSGLRAQDLQEAKDQLLVETSDMLRVPLFTAEALLRNYEWSREMLLEAWMSDPVACCEKCGVHPPNNLLAGHTSGAKPRETVQKLTELPPPMAKQHEEDDEEPPLSTPTCKSISSHDTICDICAMAIPVFEDLVCISCNHQFCRACWESYLNVKIQDGNAHNILCPAYRCEKLVPVEIIEKLVSRDMAKKYLQFDIQAFVESNPTIKWCPYPGCGRAVRLPENDAATGSPSRAVIPGQKPPPTSHAVNCGNGHNFCWECLGEAHEPCSCDKWTEWFQKIADVKPESLGETSEETEAAANCLWLVSNSKPCPSCKSPIQKNEGCNHMKCSKCKYDFCWVCLEAWKKHSSATGGYFRCNRYDAIKKADESSDSVKAEAEARNRKLEELNRFMHYYTRFKNHENSHQLEEPLLSSARQKMSILASAILDEGSSQVDTKFIEDAIQELLKSRRVLRASYVYGYYLEDQGYNKTIFEFMQTELEEVTESLSQMIARPYLRTPRYKIVQTALLVKRKRQEFVLSVSKGLIPPETPPSLRRFRRRHFPNLMDMEMDDKDFRKAISASLKAVDPNDPWVKDSSGRHTNLAALYDWPDTCESDDSDTTTSQNASVFGICSRAGCTRPRAQNPRTGAIHDYCSLRCSRRSKAGSKDDDADESSPPNFSTDYGMELMLALEMSRLQLLHELGQQSFPPLATSEMSTEERQQPELELNNAINQQTMVKTVVPSGEEPSEETANWSSCKQAKMNCENMRHALHVSRLIPPENSDDDPDLRIAIQLSLQESFPNAVAQNDSTLQNANNQPDVEPSNTEIVQERAPDNSDGMLSNEDDAVQKDSLPKLEFQVPDPELESVDEELSAIREKLLPSSSHLVEQRNMPDTLVLPGKQFESFFLKDLEDKDLDYSNNLRTRSPKEDLKTAKQLFKFDQTLDHTSESILRNINRKIITDVSKEESSDEMSTSLANFDGKAAECEKFPCSNMECLTSEAVDSEKSFKTQQHLNSTIEINRNNLADDNAEPEGAVGGVTEIGSPQVVVRPFATKAIVSCSSAPCMENLVREPVNLYSSQPSTSGFRPPAVTHHPTSVYQVLRPTPMDKVNRCLPSDEITPQVRPSNFPSVPVPSNSHTADIQMQFPDEIPVTEKFKSRAQTEVKSERKCRAESPLGMLFRRSSGRKKNGSNKTETVSRQPQADSPQALEFNNRSAWQSAEDSDTSSSPVVIWMKRENKERERALIEKKKLERSHSEEGTASCRITEPPSSGRGYLLRTYSHRSKRDCKFGRVNRDQDKKTDKDDKKKRKLKRISMPAR